MVKKYIVSLSEAERQELEQMVTTGKRAAYTINHARILLKADCNQANGSWCDQEIKESCKNNLSNYDRTLGLIS